MQSTNGTIEISPALGEVIAELNRPQTAAALKNLARNAELLDALVNALDGFLRRSEQIAENVGEGLREFAPATNGNGDGRATLAALLEEVLDAGAGIDPSFFEASTAAAFLAFRRTPADLCIIEVGMGGRLDATNVFAAPAICGIAALGLDHQAFLGETLAEIAGEKAGIAKPGVPIATLAYPEEAETRVDAMVAARGGKRLKQGVEWDVTARGDTLTYRDAAGELALPVPALEGPHQHLNAGLAIAMVRHQQAMRFGEEALARGLQTVHWPARLQRLKPGPLVRDDVWLDGGHNASAGAAIARHFAGRKLDLVIGMLANKDAAGFLALLAPVARSVTAVPIEGHEHHPPDRLVELAGALELPARTAANLSEAMNHVGGPALITGSLYLAGMALALNGEAPD